MSDPSPEQLAFREGMSRLGAAVNIITTDGPAGRYGLTATAVCSVTDTPPTLLVCVNQNARSHNMFVQNGVLCVNVLTSAQEDLSNRFSRLNDEDRFASTSWQRGITGAPILPDALTAFDCKIVERLERGTHSVFMCEVVATLNGSAAHGLLWFGRRYHRLPASG